MKNFTRILIATSLVVMVAFNAQSQDVFKSANVGIGTITPQQKLDVAGSIRFTWALMPNGAAGTAGNILLSGGASPNPPTWLPNGTSGQVLAANGTGMPTWTTLSLTAGWALTGNSIVATNFLGTTDAQPLVFKVNNIQAGRIDLNFGVSGSEANTYLGTGSTSFGSAGGSSGDGGTLNVGIGVSALGSTVPFATINAGGNVAVGAFAYPAATAGDWNTSVGAYSQYSASFINANQGYNVAIGAYTMYSNNTGASAAVTGSYNTAIGYQSMYGSAIGTYGNYNTALGYNSLYNIAAGGSNTALGSNALYNTTAGRNVGVGDSALYSNTTGEYNTGVGYQSNVGAGNLTNATAIGYQASAPVSNSITLGNSSVAYNGITGAGLYLPGYASVGAILYTAAATGQVAALTPGTAGTILESTGTASVPTWVSVAGINTVAGTPPIYVNSSSPSNPIVSIQGENSGLDEGGVLYSAGAGNPAVFTPTGTANYVLQSNGTSAPTWVNPATTTAWSLAGNSNAIATSILGTTDAEPLVFKVNNTYAGRLDINTSPANTYLGYGTGGPTGDGGIYEVGIGYLALNSEAAGSWGANVAVGAYSYPSATEGDWNVSIGAYSQYSASFNNSTAGYNIAVGAYSLYSNSSGASASAIESFNTAIGYQSMYGSGTTTAGDYNVALGYNSLYSISTGGSNTALGTYSLYNTTAGKNTAAGDSALYSNTTGEYNTALGYQANVSVGNLTNATAIGANAQAGASNTVILGSITGINNATANASVGIGTTTPARTLEIGGTTNTIRVDGLANLDTYNTQITSTGNIVYSNNTTGDLYSLPNGANGTVLTLNANSVPSWASPNASLTTFSITGNAGTSVVIGGGFANSVVGASNVSLDVQGTAGGVFYGAGSGTAAAFSVAGTSGQVLTSGGAGAPTWSSFNSLLTTNNIVPLGGSSVVVGNGNNQVVGIGNVTLDVEGTAGGVFYGTGSGFAAAFSAAGTSGQVLTSGGAGAPTWTSLSAGWSLVGNTGTIPGTNYLGTQDDEGLVFWVNNKYAGSIDPLNTSYSAANVYLGGASTSAPILNGAGNLDAGDNNVGIGLSAMASTGGPSYTGNGSGSTTGFSSSNVAVGAYSLSSAVYAAGNVALGAYSQRLANWGSELGYNTSAGYQSLFSNSTGQFNTAIGYNSMYGSGTATAVGNWNTALGYNSLYTAGAGVNSNTAIGSYALYNTTTSHNTAVGDSALYNNTTGTNNTALGWFANVTGNPSNATVIGYGATQSASNSITLGNSSATALYLPGYAAVGNVLYTSAGTGLVGALTPGTAGTVLESQGAGLPPTWLSVAGVNSVTGTAPIYVNNSIPSSPVVSIQGNSLGTDAGGVLYSAGAGNPAVFTPTGTSGYILESQGASAPIWVSPSAASGWALTGNAGTSSANFLGPTTSGEPLIFKVNGVFAGDVDYLTESVSLGYGAASGGGGSALYSASVGGSTVLGYEAAYNNNNDLNGCIVGAFALYSATSPTAGNVDVAVGYSTQYYTNYNGAFQDVSVGAYSLYSNSPASGVVAGEDETAIGYKSMYGTGTSSGYFGNYNTAIGYQSLYDATAAAYVGASNTAAGSNALVSNTGAQNTAVGDSALATNTTGTQNTALGYQADVSSSGLSNATAIGYKASAPASNSITLGNTSVTSLYLPGYISTGDLLYTSTGTGLVASLTPGTSGTVLESQGAGLPPTWLVVTPPNSVTGTAPIYITGTAPAPDVNIQGLPAGTDAGGVLYSTGAGTSAVFTATPASAGLVLTSAASGGAPTWQTTPSASGAWSLTGNTTPTYGTDFLGFTAAVPAASAQLEFVSNGQYTGLLDVNRANIFFGRGAGGDSTAAAYTAKAGSEQEAIGAGALESATTASAVVAIGYDALHNYTTGAGQGNGFSNNAVGAFALYSLTTGIPDNALGNEAGFSITTGAYNVSLGDVANYGQTAGTNNVAAGDSALFGGSSFTSPVSYTYTANFNTAVGVSALAATGTGTNGGTGGTENTAVGYEAGIHNTTANNNVNLGYKANYSNSTGYGNVAVGSNALLKNTHSDNVAVGTNALENTAAVGNAAVGDSAIFSNTSGTYNTAVGYQALTTTSGSNGNTTGSYNTALGYFANVSSGTLTNATAIGAYAYATQSNSMVLGSINTVNGATSNTNVCIGTNAPQSDAALAVKTLHLETQGSVASETPGSGVTSVTLTGTDVGGVVNFTIPASAGAVAQVTVNFATNYAFAPTVILTPANSNSGGIVSTGQPYATSTTTGFTITFNAAPGNGSALPLSFNYFVIETQ